MTLDAHHVSVLVRDRDTALARAHRHGLVTAGDVQLASTIARMFGSADDLVKLTAALCFASGRAGSTCLDLDTAGERFVDDVLQSRDLTGSAFQQARLELLAALDWPTPARWQDELARQPLVGDLSSEPPS